MNYKSRLSFLVLSSDILHCPSSMQLVAQKTFLDQPNDGYIWLPTAHTVHIARAYLLVCSLALPTADPCPSGQKWLCAAHFWLP
jgi:hypothetical protein